MKRMHMAIVVGSMLGLVAMLVLSVLAGDSYAYNTELASLLLLAIPAWCLVRETVVLPWPILLGIGLSLFLHSLGLVTGWYHTTGWWDGLTHFVSGITVAALAAVVLIVVIVSSKKIRVPVSWVPFLILTAVLTMEATWEILEFSIDAITGTVMQHGLADTMEDIMANTASGIIAGLGFALYISRASLRELVDGMRVGRVVAWARRRFPD